MILTGIGLLIGVMVLGIGLYYRIREKMIRNPARYTALSAALAAFFLSSCL